MNVVTASWSALLSPNAAGERRATGDHPDEREKAYAVASQLDWFVRPTWAGGWLLSCSKACKTLLMPCPDA